ncbi:MAG: LysM peptidoglycan-binding domain-containing protein [Flavobacteriales bacterium]|nr:LysM peptidoglycan-binding domain-containing protein [Flavobacteriales bacterium]
MTLALNRLQQLNGNKEMMVFKKIILSVCFVFFLATAFAQPGKTKTKIIDGKEYYMHKVKRGNTIYGLHRMYDVPVDEILSLNPEAKDGLDVGQLVKIPKNGGSESIATDTPPSDGLDATKYYVHVAKQNETLYSIARQYGLKGKVLVRINGDKPLSIGDKIQIPIEAVQNLNQDDVVDPIVKDPVNELAEPGDSIIMHKVSSGETLYALSKKYNTTPEAIKKANQELLNGLKVGEEIRIPIKKVGITQVNPVTDSIPVAVGQVDVVIKKEVYEVAVFLPFKLDKFDAELIKCPAIGDCKPYKRTVQAVEFYNGVEMAVDSMRKAGLSVNLHVYDTKGDTATMRVLLAKEKMKNMDLIFGPLSGSTQKLTAKFALKNKIQFISPVNSTNKILFKNPYVTKTVASIPTQMKAMAQYVADSFGTASILVFDNKNAGDQAYFAKVFRKKFEAITEGMDTYRDSLVFIRRGSRLKNIYPYINKEGVNVLVVPSRNLGYVSAFLTDLNKVKNDHGMRNATFIVFGLDDWQKYEQIDYNYINTFNVHLSSTKYLDFKDIDMREFVQKYRVKHNNDPGVYTYMGFDVMMQHLAGILTFGNGFASRLNYIQLDHLHTKFNYSLVGEGSGYENQNVFILAYKDYKLIKKR